MIQFHCPVCGNLIKVRDEFAGQTGTCHRCGERLRIPPLANPPIPVPPNLVISPITPQKNVVTTGPTLPPKKSTHPLVLDCAIVTGLLMFMCCIVPFLRTPTGPSSGFPPDEYGKSYNKIVPQKFVDDLDPNLDIVEQERLIIDEWERINNRKSPFRR